MKIGFDYWNVCSDYPVLFRSLAKNHLDGAALVQDDFFGLHWSTGFNEVHIISAIGKNRAGTIKNEVIKLRIPFNEVHEVVFSHPSQSPMLKYQKCHELGIDVFYDDRQDVCDYLNARGIVAFQVPRRSKIASDIEAEIR